MGLIEALGAGPAALSGGCSALVTNDRRFPEVPGLEIVQLSDHI